MSPPLLAALALICVALTLQSAHTGSLSKRRLQQSRPCSPSTRTRSRWRKRARRRMRTETETSSGAGLRFRPGTRVECALVRPLQGIRGQLPREEVPAAWRLRERYEPQSRSVGSWISRRMKIRNQESHPLSVGVGSVVDECCGDRRRHSAAHQRISTDHEHRASKAWPRVLEISHYHPPAASSSIGIIVSREPAGRLLLRYPRRSHRPLSSAESQPSALP